MDCPRCGARRLFRDYAPPRSYALLLTGLFLIFVARLLHPSVLRLGAEELNRLLVLGLLAAAYGFYDTIRHGNRYCGGCGTRLRALGRRAAGPLPSETIREKAMARGGTRDAPRKKERGGSLSAHTPVEPVLACLRFRDPEQRRTAAETLRTLTGQDFGEDAAAWEAWWRENKDAYKAARRRERHE